MLHGSFIDEADVGRVLFELHETAMAASCDLMAYTTKLQGVREEDLRSFLENTHAEVSSNVQTLNSATVDKLRPVLLDDEATCSTAGGRPLLNSPQAASAMTISYILQAARCHALYHLALVTAQLQSLDNTRIANGDLLFGMAVQSVDDLLDGLAGLETRGVFIKEGLSSSDVTVVRRGIKTCADFADALDFLNVNWCNTSPSTAPLEEYIEFLSLALGRLSFRTQNAVMLENKTVAESLVDFPKYRNQQSKIPELSGALFADTWLVLDSMKHHHHLVMQTLKEIPPGDDAGMLAIAWKAVTTSGPRGVEISIADPSDVVLVPTKEGLLKWARATIKTYASVDALITSITRTAYSSALAFADRKLHSAHFPLEDNTSATTVLVRRLGIEGVSDCTKAIGTRPERILTDNDPDTATNAGECLILLMDSLNMNYGNCESIRNLCFYREERVERLGHQINEFIIPVAVETRKHWVVTIEGQRTPPCSLTTAIRVLMHVSLALEKRQMAHFHVTPVMRLITQWLSVHDK